MVFASTYAIYKQGTAQVVSWIGKTAAQCGYAAFGTAVLTSLPGKSSKTKGSKSNQKDAQSQPSSTKYTLSSRDLPVLAKYITEHFRQTSADAFKGSLSCILEVLKDVIHRRKQWARDFKLPDPSTYTSNERHKYFVAVLEEVQQILEGLMNAVQFSNGGPSGEAEKDGADRKSQSTEDKAQSVDEKALTNMFAILEIEEPEEQQENTTLPTKSRPPSRPPTVTYEQENDDNNIEEAYFRIYCYFKDFDDIRPQIIKGWEDYKKGLVDLAAVAITTNVHLEMLQRAETELIASLPKNLIDYETIASLLVNAVAAMRGVFPDDREGDDVMINMELKGVSEFVGLPIYILVSSFVWSILERFGDDIPLMKPGYFGKADLSGKPMSWRKKFNREKIVILEFLPEFCILEKLKLCFPVLDQLSLGLMEFVRTRKLPI